MKVLRQMELIELMELMAELMVLMTVLIAELMAVSMAELMMMAVMVSNESDPSSDLNNLNFGCLLRMPNAKPQMGRGM